MRIMKERAIRNDEYKKFKDGLDRYVKIEGIESELVNIPTIITSINDDGTIRQEEIKPYAYEIIGKIEES